MKNNVSVFFHLVWHHDCIHHAFPYHLQTLVPWALSYQMGWGRINHTKHAIISASCHSWCRCCTSKNANVTIVKPATEKSTKYWFGYMVTSSNGNTSRVTGRTEFQIPIPVRYLPAPISRACHLFGTQQLPEPMPNKCQSDSYEESSVKCDLKNMMTSSNGNTFRVTDSLWGNPPVTSGLPSHRPVTRSFDLFFDLRLNKQSRRVWFETLSLSLLRHFYDLELLLRNCGWLTVDHDK